MSEKEKGVPYETRLYEMDSDSGTMLIRRLVNQNTNESLWFGQAQMTVIVDTPQGPMPINQSTWYPIEGATSPANAFELSPAAFAKFKTNLPGQRIVVPTGMPPAAKGPKGNGHVPNGLRVV